MRLIETKGRSLLRAHVLLLLGAGALSSACGTEQDEAIEETEGAILNGIAIPSTWTPQGNRTVQITGGWGGRCSGTLLRNNVVLTARHCMNAAGNPLGYADNLAAMRVRLLSTSSCAAPATACATPTAWQYFRYGDAAVLLLDHNLTVAGDSQNLFTPLDPLSASSHFNATVGIMGFGFSDLAQTQSGTKLYGQMVVSAYQANYTLTSSNPAGYVFTGFYLVSTAGNMQAMPGDSGGPMWVNGTLPKSVGGVTSGGTAGSGSSYYARAYDFRGTFDPWIDQQIDPSATYTFSSAGELSLFQQVGGAWSISGGYLRQTSDSPRVARIPNGRIFRNVNLVVNAVGPNDDDLLGGVVRYVDATHYYYAGFSEQLSVFKIVKVKDTTVTTLASVSVPVAKNWNSAHEIMIEANGSQIRAWLDGTSGLTATDVGYPLGRVGVIADTHTDGRFDQLIATQLP